MMQSTNRRRFIQQAGVGVAGAATLSYASSKVHGANERVRVALIGCGGRGTYDGGVLDAHRDAELVCVVDPHQGRLAAAARKFPKAKPLRDFRKALDDKSLDAVIIATPVHWHGPGTVAACNAGKHVYVEKPCSHNVREGRLLVEASKRNKRVVQHGTQVRSTPTIAGGVKLLREGLIGEVMMARAWNIQRRPGVGPGKPEKPPTELDFDAWLGPVPKVDYHSTLFGGWNWLRHFGTGEIGNDGIHDIDYARWGLGVETHPELISGVGGRFLYNNGAEFPDTQQVSFEYASAKPGGPRRILVYEERLWSTNYPHNCDSGVEFYGTKGQMFLSRRGKIEVRVERNRPRDVDVPKTPQDTPAHMANFLDAIRNGAEANADAMKAHLTTSLCHLGNISIRLGRSLRFDPQAERFLDDAKADKLLSRTYREGHWATPS